MNIAAVAESFEENPGSSAPRRSLELGITQTSLQRIKDLGVIFESVLRFNNHIHFICQKEYSMLGIIKRNLIIL